MAIGASLEDGWRFELGGGAFLEPQAQLSYLKVELEDIEDLQDADVVFEDSASLRGRVGLRLGTVLALEGATLALDGRGYKDPSTRTATSSGPRSSPT